MTLNNILHFLIDKCYENGFHHNLHIGLLHLIVLAARFCCTVFLFEEFIGVTEDAALFLSELSSARLNDSFSAAATDHCYG